ncbi:MAG: site-specific DNA-methyltransferase [Bacteroidia bacterium]|nr:site-specific DNA-methyltransferase [Bacteroidia bacterium]
MKKTDLINKLKQLQGISDEERAHLINLVNTKKKYGLVWEDKPEDVEEQLRENLPVLKEVKERAIINGKEYPNHILIEGDNLHALTALTFTHEGKIDLIYIDPPYNTGNKDFKYNDNFVDKEDDFRHSKWLSFMEKRLKIAKRLLTENGLIFVSIDDIECAQLKMLLDEVFNQNIVNSITVKTSESSGVKMSHVDKKLPKIKEYLLVYSKTKEATSLNPIKLAKVDDIDKFKAYAKYYSKIILNKEDPVENWKIIPISQYLSENGLSLNEEQVIEFKLQNAEKVVYRTNNRSLSGMKFDTETASVKSATGIDYVWWEGKQMLFLKDYIDEGLCDLWTDISTINLNKEICGLDSFENGQKPLELIKRVKKLYPSDKITILDFFGGSGTTLHSTIALNNEDGGSRKCILVTNNENNICVDVTYERNKRVIQGFTNATGEKVEGISNNNLRYYKSEFVPSSKSEKNKRELTLLSTDLLCIKEDCYIDVTGQTNFNATQCRIFKDGTDKYMVVVYHSRILTAVCEQLITYIPTIPTTQKVRLYVFSPEKETLLEEFQDIEDKIIAVPLPEAIYNAYRATFKILKLDKKPLANVSSADESANETDLVTQTEEA